MTKLIATRGLPGSGKSTFARQYAADLRADGLRVAVFSRDALRDLLGVVSHGDAQGERLVTQTMQTMVTGASGVDVVIVDATHLRARDLRSTIDMAAAAGVEYEVRDFTDVPLGECLRRNAMRPDRAALGRADGAMVPEEAVRSMYDRFLRGRTLPLPIPEPTEAKTALVAEPYEAKPGTPKAVMVDLDGTVADLNGRDPYNETTVLDDLPNTPVIDVVRWAVGNGYTPVFMSGRTDGCREDTERWLYQHVIHESFGPTTLFMRAAGDGRPDNVVKLELFDKHVRDNYDVRFVLDDRASVVRAWRSIGLTVFQVAEGAF
jgi:predicted kinase